METINQVIKRQASEVATHTPNTSLTYLQSTAATAKFLTRYNPDSRKDLLAHPERAIVETTNNPKLLQVDDVYGNGVSNDFLDIHITKAFAECGFDYQTSVGDAVKQAVSLIYNTKRVLRVFEVMLFLQRFASGHYGQHNRVFNLQTFGIALDKFYIERNKLRIDEEKKERQAAMQASMARSVSRAEYERMKAAGEI